MFLDQTLDVEIIHGGRFFFIWRKIGLENSFAQLYLIVGLIID